MAGSPRARRAVGGVRAVGLLHGERDPELDQQLVHLRRGAWARVTIDQFRHLALRTFYDLRYHAVLFQFGRGVWSGRGPSTAVESRTKFSNLRVLVSHF